MTIVKRVLEITPGFNIKRFHYKALILNVATYIKTNTTYQNVNDHPKNVTIIENHQICVCRYIRNRLQPKYIR